MKIDKSSTSREITKECMKRGEVYSCRMGANKNEHVVTLTDEGDFLILSTSTIYSCKLMRTTEVTNIIHHPNAVLTLN